MSDKLTRLLLVEDNPGDARLLREALREVKDAQFELVHVERLSQALERLGEERFDVILLDLSLPDGQGLDTVVRVNEQTPRVPIVVLTGLGDETMALRALREGAQDYLVKGQVDGSLLVRAMRYAVERKDAEELIQQHLKRITALRDINLATTSTLELSTVLNVLLEKIDLFLPYSSATVRLFNKESGLLEPVACRNLDEKEWKALTLESGLGLLGTSALENKAPLMVRNVQTNPRTRHPGFFRKHGLVSYLGVPLIVKDEVLGIISFYTKMEHEFTGEEVEFFSTLAGQAAIAIHNARLYAEARTREAQLQETNRMLSALHAVAAAAGRLPDLDRVLRLAIEKIRDIFRLDITRIHIYDERADELVLRAAFDNNPGHSTSAQSLRRGEGVVGKVAESGKPLIFEDVRTDPLYRQLSRPRASDQFGYRFFAVFPIKGKLTNLGTLSCVGTAPRKLGSGEIQLLEAIAERIGVAIENSELYEQLRQKVNELQQKTAELERANKVKDEFLSVISHELRTPLTVIIGYLGMIKDRILGEINQEQEKALERVMIRANDQLAMITSILHATQIEAEEVKVERYEVSLGDFLQHLKSLYELPLGKEVALNWDYPSDLPVVKTDGEKVKNILQNLINNAIKFTEKGSVTVSARYFPRKNTIEFKVTDTGIGIEKEFSVVIFDRFRQVDSSETRPYGGVGIGLYIVKRYTELLGGKVEVESKVGKGSTFTVTIPCEIFPLGVGEQRLSAESKGLNA